MSSAILIRLLGGEAKASAVLESVSWRFGEGGWPAGLAMLLVVAIGLAWWAYRRSPMGLNIRRRLLLTALRASFLALLGLVFLQPLLRLTLARNVPRTLLIGIDQSESFGLRDLQREATRLEVATRVLTHSNLWPRLGENLKLATYGFGEDLTAVDSDAAGLSPLAPESPKTALGSAVIRLLARHAGEPLAGIVLLTDGNNNHGPSLESVAERLQALGAPLHIIGIGAEATVDSGIDRIEAPEKALAGEVLPVRVHVRSQGLTGEPGEIVLSLSGQEVARRAFVFDGTGEQEVDLEFLPSGVGSYRIEAGVESGRQELVERNNRASEPLRVIEGRMRVLMIEQAPRWEFKYLQAMLLREARVELRCLLLEGDPAAARVPGSPYLDSFPQREELLGYDLVFLGDVEPRLLTDAEWLSLKELVAEAGGALVVIAGKRFMPGAYRHRLLEPMLPIALASAAVTPGPATQPWHLHPVRNEPMLTLADDPEAQGQAWRKLPPIFWMADIAGAKPAAEVLLVAVAEGADLADERGAPVAVLQRYGAGEVLFMGTDNTWRWRRNAGDRIHTRFWAQVVQRLAGQRLVQGSRRASIQTERRRYEPGERVAITAMLRSAAWAPLTQPTATAVLVADGSGESRSVEFQAVPGQPGAYRAEIVAGAAGIFRLTLPDDGDALPAQFEVRAANREFDGVTLDAARLRRVAESTGGFFYGEEDAAALPDRIVNRSAQIRHTREVAFWASPLYFILLLLLLATEWIVRKLYELK